MRGGLNGDTPNPVSDTARLADSRTESRPPSFWRGPSGVTKRVYVSSFVGRRRRADIGIRASLRKRVQELLN
jgi:hypothetical protein